MIPKEISDQVAELVADIAAVKYCNDIPRGYRVMGIFGELAKFLSDRFQLSSDSLEAADVLGEVIRELNQRTRKKTGRGLY